MGRRSESLANRIEEGANSLADFAEGISEKEWQTPTSSTDSRSVGVIVHHVASMYPIEVGAAKVIAGGKAVADVTWEAVASINAKHAGEQATVTKSRRDRTAAAQRPRGRRGGSRAHRRRAGLGRAVLAELRRADDVAVRHRRPRASAQLAPSRAHPKGSRPLTSGARKTFFRLSP